MRAFIGVSAALLVSGCAYFQSPLNRNRLELAIDAYGIAQTAAVEYRNLCVAGTLPVGQKGCRARVVTLQAYDRGAVTALKAANTFITNNPNSDATPVITAAEAAVSAFKAASAAFGAQ